MGFGAIPNVLIVRLETDEGLVGLGETYFGPYEVAEYVHTSAAPLLLGAEASRIDALRIKLKRYGASRTSTQFGTVGARHCPRGG